MRESFRYGCSGRGRHPSDTGFVSPTLRLMYDSPNPPFFCREKSRGPAVTPGYIGRGPCSQAVQQSSSSNGVLPPAHSRVRGGTRSDIESKNDTGHTSARQCGSLKIQSLHGSVRSGCKNRQQKRNKFEPPRRVRSPRLPSTVRLCSNPSSL